MWKVRLLQMLLLSLLAAHTAAGQVRPTPTRTLSNFDARGGRVASDTDGPATNAAAQTHLKALIPDVQLDFDPVIGSPSLISARAGFLTGPDGKGRGVSQATVGASTANEDHRATRAFLREHAALFGHGPELLDAATVKRDFVAPHNGMRTVVWEQHLAGIPIFEGLLISHTTKSGELVNISSHFLPDPTRAQGAPAIGQSPFEAGSAVSAAQAVAKAAQK